MKRIIIASLVFIAIFLWNCNSNKTIELTIRVDLSGIQDVIKDPNTLGIIGEPPLLDWKSRKPLNKQGNLYRATLQIPDTMVGKVLTYALVVDENHVENWPFPMRELIIPSKSTVLPVAKFNDLIGTTGIRILPKPPNKVKQANTPEEKAALAEPFIGITSDGDLEKNLFSIKSTGIPTSFIKKSADILLESSTEKQLLKCQFLVTDDEWRRWHNTEFYRRQGVALFEMSELQQKLTFDLLKASLSPKGVQKTEDILAMEAYLAEVSVRLGYISEEQGKLLGPEKYYITFLGTPSQTEPWGWQFEGHHLVINYFILGDQIVMTPTLMGSEPTSIEDGHHTGIKTFEEEEQLGLSFYLSLNEHQKEKATLWHEKKYDFAQAQAFRDNTIIPYAGIQASELDSLQKALLLDLIFEYVGNMREEHAQIKMEEVRTHLNETYFSWVGGADENNPFYYRVHSPVILIEFDHQMPVFMYDRQKTFRPAPTRKHIHTVIRTPNGNDYGKDLLREHLEMHPH